MLINFNLLYPPDIMAEESSYFMKNACIMDFLTNYIVILYLNKWYIA